MLKNMTFISRVLGTFYKQLTQENNFGMYTINSVNIS